jgi:hypothetical protein
MIENPTLYISQFKYRVTRNLESFQDYCRTFEFDLFCNKYLENPEINNLDDKTKVKQQLIDHFEPLKEDLLTYQYDFCSMKSMEEIANKISVHPDRVLAYIERSKIRFNKDQIKGLSEFGDVTLKTQVKNISSYGILKELQLIERQLLLSKNTEQRQKG